MAGVAEHADDLGLTGERRGVGGEEQEFISLDFWRTPPEASGVTPDDAQ